MHISGGGDSIPWIRLRKGDYSRVKRVLSTTSDSSNEPAVFAHFWLRRVTRCGDPTFLAYPHVFLTCGPFIGFLGFFGVRHGYICVGVDRRDDSSADSSASLAQCGYGGDFSPNFAIFALVWDRLRNFRFYS